MARPIKEGMDYFPHDTDAANDEKIEILRSLHGNDGYVFYFILLERIYRMANFELIVSDAETLQILARKVAVTPQKLSDMIQTAVKYHIFDPEKYQKEGILTSNGIKRRSQMVVEKREDMRKKYHQGVSGVVSDAEIGVETPQSKVKESKVKKRKIAEPNGSTDESHKEIVEVIDAFKEINPSYRQFFKNTTQRGAALRMFKLYGSIQSVKEKINWLKQTNQMPYAPVITTPKQFEDKLASLIAFINKERNKK